MPGLRRALAVLIVAPLAAACTAPGPTDRSTRERTVYVAVGASDSVGVGATDPASDAWPEVFARTALPPDASVHNLGIAGATTAEAIRRELPRALSLRPTIATVWLNVNDLTHAVPATTYERQLRHLLFELRGGGRTDVLVATTPRLDSLPAYRSCFDAAGRCPLDGVLPPPAVVRTAVDRYNAAIRSAAEATGAVVVDLHSFGNVPERHPGWVSADGFHPSTEGYRHVAAAFAAALHGS